MLLSILFLLFTTKSSAPCVNYLIDTVCLFCILRNVKNNVFGVRIYLVWFITSGLIIFCVLYNKDVERSERTWINSWWIGFMLVCICNLGMLMFRISLLPPVNAIGLIRCHWRYKVVVMSSWLFFSVLCLTAIRKQLFLFSPFIHKGTFFK